MKNKKRNVITPIIKSKTKGDKLFTIFIQNKDNQSLPQTKIPSTTQSKGDLTLKHRTLHRTRTQQKKVKIALPIN
jgi:hypothetical protein